METYRIDFEFDNLGDYYKKFDGTHVIIDKQTNLTTIIRKPLKGIEENETGFVLSCIGPRTLIFKTDLSSFNVKNMVVEFLTKANEEEVKEAGRKINAKCQIVPRLLVLFTEKEVIVYH